MPELAQARAANRRKSLRPRTRSAVEASLAGADEIEVRDHLALDKDEQNTATVLIFTLLPWPRLVRCGVVRGRRFGVAPRVRCLFATCEGFLWAA
jgi:hypothetical protein